MHYAGLSPKRPRNQIERDVLRRQKGRQINPQSPTRVAAQLAHYLVEAQGKSMREAARIAATAHSVGPDSVRKLVRVLLRGPLVRIKPQVPGWGGSLVKAIAMPLVLEILDKS